MFTELSGITEETGLSFDGESRLCGCIESFGTVVSDIQGKGEYRIDMFFSDPPELHDEHAGQIAALVTALAEGLPKNTLVSQSCEEGYVRIVLDKYELLQENIVYLIEFLDKLAKGLGGIVSGGDNYSVLYDKEPESGAYAPSENAVRIKLRFDLRSVIGLLGAAAGAFAMVVIAILTVNADFEINTLELRFEVSTYILSGITAVIVFADYRFAARKLDAFGVIVCPLLTLASVVMSGLGTGVRACARFAGASFIEVLRSFPEYLERYPQAGDFMFGYITRGVVLAVVACVGIYVFYFSRHPEETIKAEREDVREKAKKQ